MDGQLPNSKFLTNKHYDIKQQSTLKLNLIKCYGPLGLAGENKPPPTLGNESL